MASSSVDRRLGLAGGTAIKAPCAAGTTANITLSGEQTIDGVTTSGSRVLVKNQTDQTTNGIYVSDSGSWTRDLDADGNIDWKIGTLVLVTAGSANANALFLQATVDPITIGSSNITFTKIATLAASSVTQTNVQNGQFFECSTVVGTNTVTASTVGTAPAALGHGQFVFFIPANTNTGATTFNRDGLGAVAVQYNGAALIGGELQSGVEVMLYHDGTVYELMATSVNSANYQTTGSVTAASTINLDTAKPYSQITGATQINAVTLGNGRQRIVEFASTPVIANGASLILPTSANITAAAGDTACFIGEASSVVRCVWFMRASGNNLVSTSTKPTRTVYTSGTGTYTTPAGATWINVRLVGGGGGGSAQTTNAGATGGNTTFGALTGSGGVGALVNGGGIGGARLGGAGGTASGGDVNISGGYGGSGGAVSSTGIQHAGGSGGISAFGGGGAGGQNSGGVSAPANSGSGGGGGSGDGTGGVNSAAGGGAGGYVEKRYTTLSATYSYGVGAGGTGGSAGVQAGGSGGSGIIIVDEYYS